VFRLDLLERLDRSARSAGRVIDYHLKVDTGMGRLGVPIRELEEFLDRVEGFQNVRLDGVMTHFASADDPALADFTRRQMAQFESAVGQVRARGLNPSWIHQANSAAFQAYSEARGNLVRVGGVIYGLWRDVTSPLVETLGWRPVMSLRTRITYLKRVETGAPLGYGGTFVTRRESLIATLPIGYEDGLRRELSNRGRVLVRGQSAPIVGRISMDLTLIDVTDIPQAAIGDEVVILGSQGEDCITAEEVAGLIGTISYEITCAISDRVPRESGES
jgi:alanine racemase